MGGRLRAHDGLTYGPGVSQILCNREKRCE